MYFKLQECMYIKPSSYIQQIDRWLLAQGDAGWEKWVNCLFVSLNKLNKNLVKLNNKKCLKGCWTLEYN